MSGVYLVGRQELQAFYISDDIVCLMNGSRHQESGRSGVSIYNHTRKTEQILPLDKFCTVSREELYAILSCALSLN